MSLGGLALIQASHILVLSDRVVVLGQHVVLADGVFVAELTPLEVTLLRYLAARSGEAVGRDELLREVWGYAPNVQSRAIDKTVHRLRTKIEVDPAEPRHLQGVRALGYRLTGVTVQEPDTPANNLRASLNPAFGLQEATDRLREALAPPGAVLRLVGAPGSGKTRLASELGLALAEAGWSCWLVSGAGHTSADGLSRAICDALRAPWGGAVGSREAARRAITRSGPVLLVVDDAEPVAAAALLDGLMGASRWLLVGRAAPEGDGAPVERTRPLGLADGVALLVDRGRRAGALVTASPTVEAIVSAVGAHPQTLELLAPRLSLLSPEALLASVSAAVRGRSEGRWAQALTMAVESQWSGLPAGCADILARCAAFSSPFLPAAALDVQPRIDPDRVLDALQAGAALGVLLRAEGPEHRLYLPGPIRARALAHLAASGEGEAVARRVAERLTCEAEGFERDVREGRAARGFAGLERCRADLMAMIEQRSTSEPLLALRAALALAPVQVGRGPPRYVATLDALLDRPACAPLRSRARMARANAARRAGALDAARAEARALLEDPGGGSVVRAEALVLLVGTAGFAGAPWAETVALLEQALAAVDESVEPRVAVRLRVMIGTVRVAEGRLVEGLAAFQTAERWFREAGDADGLAMVSNWIFAALIRLGRSGEARRLGEAVIEACRAAGDPVQEGWARSNLAAACWDAGALDDMRAHAVAVQRSALELGDRYMAAIVHEQFAFFAVERGPLEEARHHFEQLRRKCAEIGALAVASGGVAGLGLVAHLEGDLAGAAALYDEVLSLAPGQAHRLFRRWALALRHLLAAEAGEAERLAWTREELRSFLEDPSGPGRGPYQALLPVAERIATGDRPAAVAAARGYRSGFPADEGHEARIFACVLERAADRLLRQSG